MKGILGSRWVSLAVRVTLGAVFVFSAVPKIADPPAFAQMIWNYRILPESLVNAVAIVVPWLELAAGFALIAGILRRGAALVVGGMLVVFIVALGTDLARGIAVDCGCFSVQATQRTHGELMAGMKLDILRDSGLLLMAFQVLLATPKASSLDREFS